MTATGFAMMVIGFFTTRLSAPFSNAEGAGAAMCGIGALIAAGGVCWWLWGNMP